MSEGNDNNNKEKELKLKAKKKGKQSSLRAHFWRKPSNVGIEVVEETTASVKEEDGNDNNSGKGSTVNINNNQGPIYIFNLGGKETFISNSLLKTFSSNGRIVEALSALYKKEQENPKLSAPPSPITYSLEPTFAGEGVSKVADGVSRAQAAKLPRETLAVYKEMLDRGLMSKDEYKQKVYWAIKKANQIGFKLNCYFWEKDKVQDFFTNLLLTSSKGLVTIKAGRLLSFYIEGRGYFVFGKLSTKGEKNMANKDKLDETGYLRREVELNSAKPKKGMRQPISYKNHTSPFKCETAWRKTYDAMPPTVIRVGDIDADVGIFKYKSSSRSEITFRNKGDYFEIELYMRVLPGDRNPESKRNQNLIRTFDLFKNYMLNSMSEIDIAETSVPDPQLKKKQFFLSTDKQGLKNQSLKSKESTIQELLGAIVHTIDNGVGFKELGTRKRKKVIQKLAPDHSDLYKKDDNALWRKLIDEIVLSNRMLLETEAMLNESEIVVIEADSFNKMFYIWERKKSSDTEYE